MSTRTDPDPIRWDGLACPRRGSRSNGLVPTPLPALSATRPVDAWRSIRVPSTIRAITRSRRAMTETDVAIIILDDACVREAPGRLVWFVSDPSPLCRGPLRAEGQPALSAGNSADLPSWSGRLGRPTPSKKICRSRPGLTVITRIVSWQCKTRWINAGRQPVEDYTRRLGGTPNLHERTAQLHSLTGGRAHRQMVGTSFGESNQYGVPVLESRGTH